MKLLTGLFRAARKRLQTTDNDMGMFRTKLEELVKNKDTLGDDEVETKVGELVEITQDLPESEDKAKLLRFIEDFKSVKEQDAAVAEEAAKAVAELFEKLDAEAMKDAPAQAAESGTETEEKVETEETVEEKKEPEDTGGIVEEKKEKAVEEKKVEDADPNPEYSLEEIYQFCKKRMAEDADAEAEEKTETEEEDIDEEVVTDHAPAITLGGSKPQGSLSEMFSKMKNGGK